MNILLVGEYYSENLGDPLLCQTVAHILKERWPDANIIPFDMSGRINPTEYYAPVTDPRMDNITKAVCDRFLYYRRAAICRAYDSDKARHIRVWYHLKALQKQYRFDLVIFAGGSLFMDYFAGVINLIVRRFAFTRTKILFHACGMSTLSEDGEYLLRQVLCSKKVVSISLRDSYERFLGLFPVREKTVETFDTGLNCSRIFPAAGRKQAEYGIGLIDRWYDKQVALLRYFVTSEYPWKAFTNGSPYDQQMARQALLEAGVPEEKMEEFLVKRPETISQLLDTVTGFDRIVSFRMHSQIAAASFGIPTVGFAWDTKISEFYQKLGVPMGCFDGTEDFAQIHSVFQNYEDIRKTVLKQGEESKTCLIRAVEQAIGQR